MSREHAVLWRKGLLGTGMLVALLMLASFYSIVSGAVDRAAHQRLATAEGSVHPATASTRSATRPQGLLARVDN
jgi:hypothetical protein